MYSLVSVISRLDLAVHCSSGHHAFGIAFPNEFQRRTGDRMKVPRLGIHR